MCKESRSKKSGRMGGLVVAVMRGWTSRDRLEQRQLQGAKGSGTSLAARLDKLE